MALGVMICYARSGGTILNRCLAAMPAVAVLSEVNPLAAGGDDAPPLEAIQRQLRQWYQIDAPGDSFAQLIDEAHRQLESKSMHLIVRDWPYVNFAPHPCNDQSPPNRLLTVEALSAGREPKLFGFTRDAIDVMLSSNRQSDRDAQQYLAYVKALQATGAPLFKFEDFCRDPEAVLRRICQAIDIPFDPRWSEFDRVDQVRGDVSVKGGSRGARAHNIAPLPRKYAPRELRDWLNHCPAIRQANELLGYPTRYEDAPQRQGAVGALKDKVVRRLRRRFK